MTQKKKVTWYSVLVLIVLAALFSATTYYYYGQKSAIVDDIATKDVELLRNIFKKIDEECGISKFDYDINHINFLTVQSFVGSEVGSMNLMYPKEWNGPYLSDNPTLQDTYYIIARLADGYYIMPGIGVTLSDGRVIGTDIIVSSDVSSQSLEGLQDNKKSLIASISVTGDHS